MSDNCAGIFTFVAALSASQRLYQVQFEAKCTERLCRPESLNAFLPPHKTWNCFQIPLRQGPPPFSLHPAPLPRGGRKKAAACGARDRTQFLARRMRPFRRAEAKLCARSCVTVALR